MYKYLVLFCLLLSGCMPSPSVHVESHPDYRAFISTRIALASMVNPVVPDDEENEELCDGSGWIVQGDGHRTECPGCKACEKSAYLQEDEYYVYHFGAKWCAPCEKLKKETWENKDVKQFFKNKNIELILLDVDNPKHSEFFKYYKVEKYPTVILLDKDKLSNVMYRSIGFKDSDTMIKSIDENIPASVLEDDNEWSRKSSK